jgi:hypothetical protein
MDAHGPNIGDRRRLAQAQATENARRAFYHFNGSDEFS